MNYRVSSLAVLAVATGLLAAGCGGGATEGSGTPSAGAPIPGGGLSIAEAQASTLEGPLMVKGFLVGEKGGALRLCTALLESYPPQCGGPSLVVEGLDPASVESLKEESGATWTDRSVSLLGDVNDGTLSVSKTSL